MNKQLRYIARFDRNTSHKLNTENMNTLYYSDTKAQCDF